LSEKSAILVIGAGSWGTALALVLVRNGYRVYLWDSDGDHMEKLIRDRGNNRHHPGIPFPDALSPTLDIHPLLEQVREIVLAVPCEGLSAALRRLRATPLDRVRICLACKGLEPETHSLSHLVVRKILGEISVAVLSGPSFAREVAAGLPTAVAVASEDLNTAAYFATLFHDMLFRVYTQDDVIGVQIGGAVKNVMAIAAGAADGLGFGANARAALITRGLAEITRLGVAMGARRETFMGLAGLGDLVLTCTDDQSRNRRLGLILARGGTVESARQEIGQAIEGIATAEAVHHLAGEYAVEMPISEQIYNVLYRDAKPRDAVQALLARERRTEFD
jgi:glycerol-3-phosphate dehydrogenase (NAD(P)+)